MGKFGAHKMVSLLVVFIFAVVSCGCGHSPPKTETSPSTGGQVSAEKDGVYYTPPEKKWYQREDVQILLLTLAIVGIAIAAGAAVTFSSGGGGLHVGASQ